MRGSIKNGVYSNKSLRIEMNVPIGWTQLGDSILDAAQGRQKEDPDRETIEPLALYAVQNPVSGSLIGMDCWPLFLRSDVHDLEEYVDKFVAQENAKLAAQKSTRTVLVERLNGENNPAVKFTVDRSDHEQTLIGIEVVRLKAMGAGGEDLVIRQSAWLRDSAEIPLIDSLFASYREVSVLEF